jgi:transglycosylase-like protein with SLT domain
MPFDDLEEQQDQTALLPPIRRVLYPFAGTVQPNENTPSARVDVPGTMQRLSPPVKSVQRPMQIFGGPQSQVSTNRQRPDMSNMGIGHRIAAMGKQPATSIETQLPSRFGQEATFMSTPKIGHRILALGQQTDRGMLKRALPTATGRQLNVGLEQPERNQGFFANFVPSGADRLAGRGIQNPFSLPGADLRRTGSNLAFEKGGSFPGSLGFGRNLPSAQDKLGIDQSENNVSLSATDRHPLHKPVQQSKKPHKRAQQQPAPRPAAKQAVQQGSKLTFFFRKPPPDPTWTDLREYIAQEARAYGIPVQLAEAVARHESNFDIHRVTPVYDRHGHVIGYDRGVMQVNDTNSGWASGPQWWGFKVDPERVANDWKYNVHVGMAILRNAYAGATLNTIGEENIARETYARYNAPKRWRQLYTVPGGKVHQHVDQFMKSWRLYYPKK